MAALYGVKPLGLRRISFASDGFCIIARLATMSDRAVFFDATHRRWWWVKRLGTMLGLFDVVTISAWLVSLFTAPLLPGMRGITIPIVRSLRRSVRFPRHRTRAQQFLLKRDRDKLLAAIAKDKLRRLTQQAKGPISPAETGSGIV